MCLLHQDLVVDFYNNKEIYSDSNLTNDENLSRMFFSFKTGTSIGYNGKKFYFGSELKYHAYSENFDKNEISSTTFKNNISSISRVPL